MQVRSWGQLLGEAKEYVKDDTVRIPTGFPSLDNLLRGGLRPGHVGLFIGRTGVGKTAVSTQFAVNAVTEGFAVNIASLEMGREEMGVRALSAFSGKPVWDMEQALVHANGKVDPVLVRAASDMRGLTIDDSTKPHWDDLARWVDETESVLGTRPRMVVVDHLKLMKRYGYPRGEAERVAQLAEDAKAFAKNCDVALLVVHQVSRSVEASDRKNHGDIPLAMEDMMYGGEQDADYVFGVYRPELGRDLEPEKRRVLGGLAVLQLLKNRHGDVSLEGIPLNWCKPSMRFEEAGGEVADYFGRDNE